MSRKQQLSFVQASGLKCVLSDVSLYGKVPEDILAQHEVHEWKHAAAILKADFPDEFDDVVGVLRDFRLRRKHVLEGGGRKTRIAESLDQAFNRLGWCPKRWETAIVLDEERRDRQRTRSTA